MGRKDLENSNNFSLKIRPELKIANFLITILNIEKTPYRRVAPSAVNHTFFDSHCIFGRSLNQKCSLGISRTSDQDYEHTNT